MAIELPKPIAVTPVPNVRFREFTKCGSKPLSGGQVWTYEANSTTPKLTYQDPYGFSPNTNPIILDAAGEADIYLNGTYRFVVKDKRGVVQKDVAKIGSWYSGDLEDQFKSLNDALEKSAEQLMQPLQDAIDTALAAGAGEAGWTDSLISTENGRTQRDKNKEVVSVFDYLPQSVSLEDALQRAINANPRRAIRVNSATYDLTSVNIPHSVSFICDQSVIFKRKNNIDVRQDAWNDGTSMFETKKQGVMVLFFGAPTFDGNNQNQLNRFQEPVGFSFKIQKPESPVRSSAPVLLYMQNPKFINGTSGYLWIRGDDFNRRYLTKVILDNPEFSDTLMGTGKGDPTAITALGYQPNYGVFYDYVHLYVNNLSAEFSKKCTTGEYAPVALLGTFFGNDHTKSGECSFFLNGTTKVTNMGRSGKLYNDDTNFLINNGIGAIDIYGKGETLYIENFIGENNQNVSVRAKASIEHYAVKRAMLKNCHRGLQVSSSTTGTSRAVVDIGSLTTYGGTIPQLEITGTSVSDRVKSVTIGPCDMYGDYTNPENLNVTSHGNYHIRNAIKLSAVAPRVFASPVCGVRLQDIDMASISSIVSVSDQQSLFLIGVDSLDVFSVDLTSNSGAAISIQDSVKPSTANISGGRINSAVDNGVLNAAKNATVNVNSLHIKLVSGKSKGFVNAVGSTMRLLNCSTTSNVEENVLRNGSNIFETGNSWNPSIQYGAYFLTTIGSNKLGDIVYNTAPAPGKNIGWVCIQSGSPGSWKEFGVIAN